jgi:hypothetical protein
MNGRYAVMAAKCATYAYSRVAGGKPFITGALHQRLA